MPMNIKRRESALQDLQHVLAAATQLHDILTRVADVRSANSYESDDWHLHINRAREMLGKALADVTRNAVL